METRLSGRQLFWLVLLRVFIGWHFLYEGAVKILNPGWSAKSYLLDSGGWFSGLFTSIAGNGQMMRTVDLLNEWGLLLVGAGLLLGCLSRLSAIGGILLLILYTMSHPAFINAGYAMPFEGSYYLIDKNLIEMAALAALFVIPTGREVGLDRFLVRKLPEWFKGFII